MVLATVRSLNSEIRVGTLVAQDPLDPALLGPDAPGAICPAIGMCSEEVVGAIRGAGRDCYVWTVNEPAQVDRLGGWGVGRHLPRPPRAPPPRLAREGGAPGTR